MYKTKSNTFFPILKFFCLFFLFAETKCFTKLKPTVQPIYERLNKKASKHVSVLSRFAYMFEFVHLFELIDFISTEWT